MEPGREIENAKVLCTAQLIEYLSNIREGISVSDSLLVERAIIYHHAPFFIPMRVCLLGYYPQGRIVWRVGWFDNFIF